MEKITNFKSEEYKFLSNFYPVPITWNDELIYNSVEHAYQAAKTTNSVDRDLIRNAKSPGEAKKLAKKLQIRADWEEVKLGIMEDLVRRKFSFPYLKAKLLLTGDAILEEGNWWGDLFWGVDKKTGIGENHLGKILMKIREELKNLEKDE